MDFDPADLAKRCPDHKRIWVAFSGGLDSTVLLHALERAHVKPRAVHVNHQLQPGSHAWADHCRALCEQWEIPFELRTVGLVPDDPAGPEAAARNARYDAIRAVMKPGDVLVTAHHRGDQAETVLLRLLRGTGVSGLAAIAEVSDFPPGKLWRPLLPYPREALAAYAREHHLQWVEDPHNADPRFARSYLRSEIMPRLRYRWPASEENIARAAANASEARELLRELADADLAAIKVPAGLSVDGLLRLTDARRHNAVRTWIEAAGFEAPPADALERLDREVLRARPDREPLLGFGSAEVRRFRGVLFLMRRLPSAPDGVDLHWRSGKQLILPQGCGWLQASASPSEPWHVRFPKGGERIKPPRARHTRTLKNLFQEAGVPPWIRERTPLVYRGKQLLWVGGIGWATRAGNNINLRWRPDDGLLATHNT
ncbi:MAG TPA: tRNA lysidine(34) synthetase TilS [Nevskiaceae bacterium]|nr:tRNA lysidine(34) synthetase TilS [Nevskiaceae bacterium]